LYFFPGAIYGQVVRVQIVASQGYINTVQTAILGPFSAEKDTSVAHVFALHAGKETHVLVLLVGYKPSTLRRRSRSR
jgi:hypothetical protein